MSTQVKAKAAGVIKSDQEGHADFLKQLEALATEEASRYYDYGQLVAEFNSAKINEIVFIEMPKAKRMFLIETLARRGLILHEDYKLTITRPAHDEGQPQNPETAFIVRVSNKQGSTAPVKRGCKSKKQKAAQAPGTPATPSVGQLQADLSGQPQASATPAAASAAATPKGDTLDVQEAAAGSATPPAASASTPAAPPVTPPAASTPAAAPKPTVKAVAKAPAKPAPKPATKAPVKAAPKKVTPTRR